MNAKRLLEVNSTYRITNAIEGYIYLVGRKALAISEFRVRVLTGAYQGLEVPARDLELSKLGAQPTCRCSGIKYPHRLGSRGCNNFEDT